MKLGRRQKGRFVFSLNAVEQKILLDLLNLYPLVPASHQKLSKSLSGRQAIEAQQLLDEALAEQRAQNRNQLEAWLKAKGRFRPTKAGINFSVPHDDVDWLLQILNDIRIGSWLLLGSPDEHLEPEEISPELRRVWASMQVSGMFQSALLDALAQQPPNAH